MRYESKSKYGSILNKRKQPEQSSATSSDRQSKAKSSGQTKVLDSSYNQKKIKLQEKLTTNTEPKIKVEIVKTNTTDEINSQWLVLESNSCRLDSFFTIFQFCILHNLHFDINALNNKSNRKIRDTIDAINNGENIAFIQQQIRNFALYRQIKHKEKIGELHSIVPLFTELNDVPYFYFSINDVKDCTCGQSISRVFNLGPLISITTANMKTAKGNTSNALRSVLKGFKSSCSNCNVSINTRRKVQQFPKFLFLLLEICDEYENLEQRKKFKDFASIKLSQTLKLEKSSFSLTSICYFQRKHYSVHIRRVSHPELKGLESEQWSYHDGGLNNGCILQSNPSLNFDVNNNELLPYILLYVMKD